MPFVPVIVGVKEPLGARRFALIVNVEPLPEVVTVTGFGVNEPFVFDGSPEMLRLTELLPPTAARLTVTLPLDPRLTVRDGGGGENTKSAVTFTVTVVLCVPLGPVPVMVSV